MKINNYEDVCSKLVDTLCTLDAEASDFQTDIYLYVDDDGNGTIDTYVNVGGNSWLNDDHITLYADKPHHEEPAEWAEDMTVDEIAAELKSLYGIEYQERAWQILDDADIE